MSLHIDDSLLENRFIAICVSTTNSAITDERLLPSDISDVEKAQVCVRELQDSSSRDVHWFLYRINESEMI